MVCRGRLRPHPQFCDGTILGFTPFRNVNCAHGFIYISTEIPLRSTPHQITYHADVNLYALLISTLVGDYVSILEMDLETSENRTLQILAFYQVAKRHSQLKMLHNRFFKETCLKQCIVKSQSL